MSALPARVLMAIDAPENATMAARAAFDVARAAGSELHIVCVWRMVPSSRLEAFIRRELGREAQRTLDEQVRKVEAAGGAVASAHVREGPKAEEILDLAGDLGADLIVIGTTARGTVGRLLLGTTSDEVVYHARCPVLVVRGEEDAWPPQRVVIGDDGSEPAKAAARLALGIGHLFEASALLVRAYSEGEDEPENHSLEERADEIGEEVGLVPEVRVARGNPAEAILEAAREGGEERSLVAVGRRGVGARGRLRLGSVSTRVLRNASGPVLVCPDAHTT